MPYWSRLMSVQLRGEAEIRASFGQHFLADKIVVGSKLFFELCEGVLITLDLVFLEKQADSS